MVPILYDSNEIAFTSNGLGRLADCIRATVTEERNGMYECEFEYPVNGAHFDEITEGRYIAVSHDDNGDIQPFEIYRSSKPINGVVTFNAHHLSYALNGATIPDLLRPPGQTAATLMTAAQSLATGGNVANFTFTSDIATTLGRQYSLPKPTAYRQWLGGMENSVLDLFGGEYEFDKWTVTLHQARGANNGVRIAYGKNLVDFEAETDYSGSYTAVVPYWKGQDGDTNTDVTVIANVVDSGHTINGHTVTIPLDLSDKFENKPTTSQLATEAANYMSANRTWEPAATIDIDFVQLWQTEEYKNYAPLQRCRLCDTVNVSFGLYGLQDMAIKIVQVEWDALQDRYEKMTLGGIATGLGESITAGLSGSVQVIGKALDKTSASRVTDVTVNGTSVVTDGVATLPTIPTKTSDLTNDNGFITAPTVQTATISSTYTGTLSYAKLGRMVIFGGTIGTTGALSNGGTLATGLPANNSGSSMFYALNNNSTSENVPVYITNTGNMLVRGSFASSSRSLRVSGAYISSS